MAEPLPATPSSLVPMALTDVSTHWPTLAGTGSLAKTGAATSAAAQSRAAILRVMKIPSSREQVQLRVLQQDDGLGVADAAVRHHGERLRERQFQNVDVLAL